MTVAEFKGWAKEEGLDLGKEEVYLENKVCTPGAMGVYLKGRRANTDIYALYEVDVNGSFDILETGHEDKVMGKLAALLRKRKECRKEGTLTLEGLYAWAKEKGLEGIPICVFDDKGTGYRNVSFDYAFMDNGFLVL